jgi:predicted metal-dependent hydrolase
VANHGAFVIFMAKQRIIELIAIGPVLFRKNSRAKHLNILVKPFSGVRVTVPRGVDFKTAEQIVSTKTAWLKKHLDRIKIIERAHVSATKHLPAINREEARNKLTSRLNYIAEKHGFAYNRLFIRNQKTRWGSCSGKKNINLNMKRMRLPDDLIDFVILHELVHTKILDHSKKYWAELLTLEPDAKNLTTRMKQYAIALV